MECIKNELNINASVPNDFNGVPSANNQLAWFASGNAQSRQDRELLWKLFESAIDYADNNNNKEALENYYDHAIKIKNVKQAKLTSALFWIRPNKFISLDSNNVNELKKEGYIVKGKEFNGKEYFEFCNELLNKGVDFPTLSNQAYNNDVDYKEQKSIGSLIQMSNKIQVGKNTILYGPPGTGKTYSTIAYALSICCGDKTYEEYLNDLKKSRKEVIKKYDSLKKEGLISFVTFHQSYGYEDFIQGIKPSSENGEIFYDVEDGIFKAFCKTAINRDIKNKANTDNFEESWKKLIEFIEDNEYYEFEGKRGGKFRFRITKRGDSLFRFNDAHFSLTKESIYSVYRHEDKDLKYRSYMKNVLNFMKIELGLKDYEEGSGNQKNNNYVFIIDEINRGNISKIFGELITLIEEDKRIGEVNELKVKLPNQGEDEDDFGIPSNVYIIGTMNTADRSIALLDTALRRRFKFVEMMPNYDVLSGIEIKGLSIKSIAKKINDRIEVLFDREHMIGHAYYLKLNNNKTIEGLADLFKNLIIPLLQEYFYDDYEKIRYILGDNGKDEEHQFIQRKAVKFEGLFNKNVEKANDDELTDDDLKVKYYINDDAFNKIESYNRI